MVSKRKAVIEAFGDIPALDSQFVDFLFPRRHLAKVPERGHQELRYIVEFDELEHAILQTLAEIRKRDGTKICQEVIERIGSLEIEGELQDARDAGMRPGLRDRLG